MTIEHDEFDKWWDAQPHTPDEYRREIRALRDRCVEYGKQLADKREEEARESVPTPEPEFMKDLLEIRLRIIHGDRVLQVQRLLRLEDIKQLPFKVVGMEANSAWEMLKKTMKTIPKEVQP